MAIGTRSFPASASADREPEPPPTVDVGRARPGCGKACSAASLNTVADASSSLLVLAALVWPLASNSCSSTRSGRDEPRDCLAETVRPRVGACWPFIAAKFSQFMYGFYPEDERWRADLTFALGGVLLVPLLIPRVPHKPQCRAVLRRLSGRRLLPPGRRRVRSASCRDAVWGGLLVTLVVAVTGIVASLPLGILLALARRSDLPVLRTSAVDLHRVLARRAAGHGAVLRHLHAAAIPAAGWEIDGLLRVLVGVALFAAAYMAEVIRGGLQAIPRGQYEARDGARARLLADDGPRGPAAGAASLSSPASSILHRALQGHHAGADRRDLRSARADCAPPSPIRTGRPPLTLFTGFAFAGMIYFLFCFGMSRYSLFLERRLTPGVPN